MVLVFIKEDDVSDDLLSVRDWCLQGPLALKCVFQVGQEGLVVLNKMNLLFSPHPQGRNVVPFHKTSVQTASL